MSRRTRAVLVVVAAAVVAAGLAGVLISATDASPEPATVAWRTINHAAYRATATTVRSEPETPRLSGACGSFSRSDGVPVEFCLQRDGARYDGIAYLSYGDPDVVAFTLLPPTARSIELAPASRGLTSRIVDLDEDDSPRFAVLSLTRGADGRRLVVRDARRRVILRSETLHLARCMSRAELECTVSVTLR